MWHNILQRWVLYAIAAVLPKRQTKGESGDVGDIDRVLGTVDELEKQLAREE